MLPKSTSATGAMPHPRQPWPRVQVEGDAVDLSRATLPQQGQWVLLPCPVGSPPALLGCGRWTQPWADSDTQTEPQEGGAPVGGSLLLSHALVLLLVCMWQTWTLAEVL